MKHHEINGNYYRVKKVRDKIKTLAVRSESGIAVTIERSPSESCASGLFGTGRRGAFNPEGILPDNRPAHLPQILRQVFLCPTEPYAQTLMFGPKIRIVVCS